MKFGEAESKIVIQSQPGSFSQTTSDLTTEGFGVGLWVPLEGRGGVLGLAGAGECDTVFYVVSHR